MAKMFYTIEEVADKLGKTTEEIRDMASSGQIQEFRDRDKLMFKVDQIDLLAGDEDTADVHIPLEDTSAQSGLDLKEDSTIGLADSREGTGISVFDTGHGDLESDTSEDTAVGVESGGEELSLESVGSGSGLLDLTRESDDTTLGAELLEEVYADDDQIDIPANASGLFEAAADPGPEEFVVAGGVAAGVPMVVESYDGSGSGLGAGLLIGALVSMVCLALIVIVSIGGATSGLAMMIAGQLWIWVGALLIATLVFGGIGWFIGKATD